MLHHPFERFTDLLSLDGHDYGSYIDAFQACRRLYTHLDDFYIDPVANDQDLESEDKSVRNESDDEPLADFELFARRWPRNDDLTCSLMDNLGGRELDCAYD